MWSAGDERVDHLDSRSDIESRRVVRVDEIGLSVALLT